MKMQGNRRRIEKLRRIRKNSAILGTSAILLVAIPAISNAQVGNISAGIRSENRISNVIGAISQQVAKNHGSKFRVGSDDRRRGIKQNAPSLRSAMEVAQIQWPFPKPPKPGGPKTPKWCDYCD